jgi:hypothetical protein
MPDMRPLTALEQGLLLLLLATPEGIRTYDPNELRTLEGLKGRRAMPDSKLEEHAAVFAFLFGVVSPLIVVLAALGI